MKRYEENGRVIRRSRIMDTVAVVGSLCDRPLLCVGYSKLVSIDKKVVCLVFCER